MPAATTWCRPGVSRSSIEKHAPNGACFFCARNLDQINDPLVARTRPSGGAGSGLGVPLVYSLQCGPYPAFTASVTMRTRAVGEAGGVLMDTRRGDAGWRMVGADRAGGGGEIRGGGTGTGGGTHLLRVVRDGYAPTRTETVTSGVATATVP